MNKAASLSTAILLVFVSAAPSRAETEADAIRRATAANGAKDYDTSIAIYRDLDQHGSGAGARSPGLMYWVGLGGVAKDHVHACDLYATAEQRGDPSGTELLADCYFKGDGRTRDYGRSAQLYGVAGERGIALSFCALGNQYLDGLGVAADPARAAVLCRKSADLGVADAQTDLGQMYLMGRGVPRDFVQSAGWFQKASNQGQPNASFLLGKQYWNGDGVARDHAQAARLWRAAALAGNRSAPAPLAHYYVGSALVSGERRVYKDIAVKALYWGMVAAQIDPNPATRAENQKMVDTLLGIAPDIKADALAYVTNRQMPPE